MAHSLSAECTPLKHEYDACFNAWFEGYLEPAVATTPQQRTEESNAKAADYQQKCGRVWERYRDCVQKAVKEKGLNDLLDQARNENPLTKPPPPPPPADSSS